MVAGKRYAPGGYDATRGKAPRGAKRRPVSKRYAPGGYDVTYGKAPRGATRGGGGVADPNADLAAAVQAWLAQQSGGGGGATLADQLAVDREQARLAAEESARGRTFEAEQNRIQREFQAQQEAQQRELEKQKQLADLEAQRQAMYVDLLGKDPARAYLFGLGYGPEHDVFTTEAGKLGLTLKPLAGAAQSAKGGEQALSKLTGRNITLGQYGVQGLSTPEQVARAYMQGTPEAQKLLTSGYGVGSTAPGAQPGISPETLQQLITLVTPKGDLNIA